MLGRSELCRGRFSIFEKKSSIFSFRRQKANSLTFCAKISSDRQIWLNCHWIRVEWTQEMVFNSYHRTRTCLDKKSKSMKKIFKIIFSLPISLIKGCFKALLERLFLSKKLLFHFLSKFRI